jgi:hydroxymethylbilane synthase
VSTELRVGTRGSQLALWQANAVAERITALGGPPCRLAVIQTSGDRLQQAPLSEVGGKRLFVKEIEDALLRDGIDLAVHSSKDMPAILPEGLALAAVLPRDDPFDAIVLRQTLHPPAIVRIEDLLSAVGQSPSFATGSVRRIAQLRRLFPCARFAPIRGNLDTRLRKLDEGAHHALVLAAAGLRRLGFASRISFALPVTACVPAPGQGIVAVEIRDGDTVVRRAVERINDLDAWAELAAERAVVAGLGGGCQTPVGALARSIGGGLLEIVAAVVALDGGRVVRAQASGPQSQAATIGAQVAARLIEEGAGEILANARGAQTPVEGIQP